VAGSAPDAAPARVLDPPSLVQLAAEAIRDMILAGEVRPGERLVEERLTQRLGISRPPLREAMRLLQREGLITVVPRRGATVTPLTPEDVWEVWTMRAALDRMAVELGVPIRDPRRLEPVRDAVAAMERAAERDDLAAVVAAGWQFHLAVASLPGHRRLLDSYRSLTMLMRLYMAMNARARQAHETIEEHVERHRRLLGLLEAGDREAALAELPVHGDRTFMEQLGATGDE
jgi:DNA-binding GntR family transcriptional regulator